MANIIKARWTTKEILKSNMHPGKPKGRVTGGWIDDLAALRKSICLCDMCKRKFNRRTYRYDGPVEVAGYKYVNSICDGCKNFTQCTLFQPEKHS